MKNSIHSILLLTLFFLGACHGNKTVEKDGQIKADQELRNKYAGLVGVDASSITNVKLYRFIDEWYGTPYQYGGKSKTGVDCSGFTSILQREVYGRSISGPAASLYDQCSPVKEKNLEEGDLVFFKINSNKISHVGVYLQNRRFVHASTKRGIVINSLDEEYYKKYYFSGGRPK